jgi:ferritin-like metal-binding protein YciE
MKLFSAHIEDLRTLYISSLKKALDMEQKITKALPDLIENSSDPELAEAFSNHLEETKGHVSKIRGLLLSNEGDDSTETCKVIDGLTTEASDTIKDVTDPSVRDIALIGVASELLQFLLCRPATDLQCRPDRAGCHAIYANPFRTKLLGK